MPEQRVRTEELLGLLGCSVPEAAIARTATEIYVCWRHPVVVFQRHKGGWVAMKVTAPADPSDPSARNTVEEHEFVTLDELGELLEQLWPMDDATADALAREAEHGPDPEIHARTVAMGLRIDLMIEEASFKGGGRGDA